MIDEDEGIDAHEFVEVAALTSRLMDIAVEYKTATVVRALASCLSMTVVNTSPSRDYAENIIENLANTILEIIENMDDANMAGWSGEDTRTLQ